MTEKPLLQRRLGLFSVTNIVIANMIGAGIFTSSGLLMGDLQNPMLMLGLWLLGGLVAMAGAFCYGEVGAAIPKAGGEYIFLSRLYSPLLGFLSGWVSFIVGFSAPIAASTLGFSEYLYRAIPAAFEWGIFPVEFTRKIFSIFIIILFTTIHLQGIRFGARVQNYLTLLKILILAGLVMAGLMFGSGDLGHFSYKGDMASGFTGWKSAALALMWISFSYSGWNAATYIGSEIKNPARNIPRSLFMGTGVVIALYLLLNVVFIYAIPPEEMSGELAIGGLAVKNMFGSSADTIFSLLVSLALFSSISAFIILGPRVYYAMARDGHFFKFAGKVNEKSKVPARSIVFQAAISAVIILTGTLDQIFTYMGFALSIFPLLVAFGVFKIRRKGIGKLRLPGFPYIPVFFIMVGVGMLFLAYFERPVESSIALLTVIAGIPAYYLFRKEKKSE